MGPTTIIVNALAAGASLGLRWHQIGDGQRIGAELMLRLVRIATMT